MKKSTFQLAVTFFLIFIITGLASAHCEIPCGIYDDQARFNLLNEHITTMEKSMKQILSKKNQQNQNTNQLVRWIMNKENHANEFQEIVSQYFMTQRLKLDAKGYDKKVRLLHQMLVYSMKCKQTTNLKHIGMLRGLVKEFQILYTH